MITEDFVSFETAKLLKEKGFNEYCRAFRSPSGNLFYSSNDIKNFEDKKTIGSAATAPTLQMAMKWLREVHNIHIVIDYSKVFKKYSFDIPEVFGIIDDFSYDTYEQTCEVAIKYCLEKLI